MIPSDEDMEQMRNRVRYSPAGYYDDGDVVYIVEVWEHDRDESKVLYGTETTSKEQALTEFDDVDETEYDVVLFKANVDSVGDDVPDNQTVDDWPRHEEPVLLSDVEVLDRRPPRDGADKDE